MRASEPTAIIGIACRFPGARDPAEFWANLLAGVDSVGEVPAERWSQTHYRPEYGAAGATRSRWCGAIDEVERFDARFFQISAREARSMDPQQRLLLEESWHCLEDAAIAPQRLRQARTGVFVGVMADDYQQRLIEAGVEPDAFSALGNYECILANRLSHYFGLSGPSLSVNAACASSLVALHLARRALAAGDCDYALVGSANLNLHPWKYRSFSQAGMLSPRGRCRSFDAGADGYVPGDGIGAVLLTGLERARAGHHRIHALVRGSATNHVGGGRSITAPSVASQRRLIEAAAADGGVDLASVQYVEAHGTGTSLGDPIEVAALEQAFAAAGAAANACVLGSVKSNLGHLEASAGMAGLIKLVLMLRHATIAPTLHVEQANPLLELEASRFRLAREAAAWPRPADGPRRAGLSSFGFGGANAHVLIEEAPPPARAHDAADGAPELFCLSGHAPDALARQADAWQQWLRSPAASAAGVRDLCGVAAQRPGLAHRLAVVAHGRADLAAALARRDAAQSDAVSSSPWRLRFASADTAWALAAHRRLCALGFAPELIGFHGAGWRAALDAAGVRDSAVDAAAPLRRPRIALQIGDEVLPPWRVRPDYLATLREAAIAGSRAFAATMQARGAPLWQRQPTFSKYLREWEAPLAQAGIALDAAFAADPPPAAVLALTVALREVDERWALGRAPRLHAEYDELVDLIVDGALERADAVALLASSSAQAVSERLQAGLARIDPHRDYRALRACNAELDEAGADPRAWLDALQAASPSPAPQGYRTVSIGADGAAEDAGIALRTDDEREWRRFVGELWSAGAPVDPAALYPPGSFVATDAPTYRFAGAKAWVATPESAIGDAASPREGALATAAAPAEADDAAAPWTTLETMRDHLIGGAPLLPGACLIEAAWTAADEDLSTVVLLRPVGLDGDERGPTLNVERDGARVRVLRDAAPVLRAAADALSEAPAPIAWLGAPLAARADPAVYAGFAERGYGYGARLRTLGASRRGAHGIEFALTANARGSLAGLIEAGFQALLAAAWGRTEQGDPVPGTALLVPFAIERLRREADALQAAERVAVAFDTLAVGRWGVRGRACVCDANGRVVLTLDGVDLRPWSAPRALAAGAGANASVDTLARAQTATSAAADTRVQSMPDADVDPALLHVPVWHTQLAPDEYEADAAEPASLWIVAAAGVAPDALAAIAPDARRIDPGAWRSVHDVERDLAGASWPQRIVALFGFAGDTSAPESTLLHLCRAVARRRPQTALELVVATFAAHAVDPDDAPAIPALSAAAGIAKSTAREIEALRLWTIDLPPTPSPAHWRALLRERGPAPLHELAYRGEHRHARALAPLQPPSAAPPLREGGAYVVVGGLGGLGRALARWLARRYRARIALIGRRGADADSAALVAELTGLGGQAEYFSADVCDRAALARALDQARAGFGALHGALHSAVAMADRSIRHLDSGHFQHVYAAKAEGSRLLAELTAGDDLQVFALFSSVLTLQGNVGQANYVAACAYQDALAERLHAQGRAAVSIGWGYWGEVGAVADAHHAQLLSEQGIPPIRVAEAEAGFAAALASGRPRVVVARLSEARRAAMAWNATPAAADSGIDAATAAAFAVLDAHARRAADHRRLLCAALEQAFNDRAGRAVRVLELGAGHGEGIERALPALDAAGARVDYLYADPSPARAAFVASRFADRARLRCIALDPDALAAAARERGFDLILADSASGDAANPLRVRAAAAWLAADGELLLIERDDAPRDWTATLAGAGLAPLHGHAPTGPATVRFHRLRRAPSPSSPSTTASTMTADRLRTLLSQITAAVLEVDAGELDPADNFTDLGVDSVLGVELVAKLNAALGTRLEPTVVYDYPTIQALAESLGRDATTVARIAPQEISQPVAAAPPPMPTQPIPTPFVASAPEVAPASPPPSAPTSAPSPAPAHSTTAANQDIAVIGMAGRFPGANTPDAFWANLAAGVDSISEVPPQRWDADAVFDADPRQPNASYCRYGGFLDAIDRFDAGFFRIAPREAERMDPQQRLLLEESWRALEDGGYAGVRREGARLGVFVGARAGDYLLELYRRGCDIDAAAFTGTDVAMLAGRVAYQLDATGPAFSVDTACSASLVAIHQACQHLRSGEADLALAGGVFVMTGPQFHVMASKAGMLAPGGRCRAFDDGAEGFVPGEGAGMVLLKPLAAALADGDHVYGVIKASGVNQDGRTNGITAPSVRSQTRLIGEVQRRGGIDPRSISYVETHGTGTRLGDPIEVEGLCAAFEADGALPPASCALGSVKTNIGHAATAAGVASLIKVLLALRARQLPPSLHFQRENAHIGFERTPFRVVTELEPWPQDRGPRRAAISSFGFSGTNAHAVIEQAPDAPLRAPRAAMPALFLLSGASVEALTRRVADLRAWLHERAASAPPAADVAYSLAVRQHERVRAAFVATDLDELAQRLDAWTAPSAPARGRESGALLRLFVERLLAEAAAPHDDGERRARLEAIGEAFVDGLALDGRKLHAGGDARIVPLPTYPFEADRHWPDAPPATTVHPLLAHAHPRAAGARRMLARTWIAAPASRIAAATSNGIVVLTGADDGGLAQRCCERLGAARRVPAPATPADGRALAEALLADASFEGLLDLSDLGGGAPPLARIALLQRLAEAARQRPMSLLHASDRQVAIGPVGAFDGEAALIAALVARLHAEHRALRARSVDVDVREAAADLAEGLLQELAELRAGGESGQIARRAGVRHRPALEPLPMPAADALPVTADGVYIVSGGVRGLGLEVARALVARGARRLLLLGRQPLPPVSQWPALLADAATPATLRERIAPLHALAEAGVTLDVHCAALDAREALTPVLERVRRDWGPIRGYVHCAGAVDLRQPVFANKTADSMQEVIAPKLAGLALADELLRRDRLDFVVAFSSVSALVPRLAAGLLDYAAANAVLAAWAEQRRAAGQPCWALAWGNWTGTGMGPATGRVYDALGLSTHDAGVGVDLLARALGVAAGTVLPLAVSDGFAAEALMAWEPAVQAPVRTMAPAEVLTPVVASVSASASSKDPATLHARTVEALRSLLARALKLPEARIDADAQFHDLGIDSILVVEFNAGLERWLGTALDPSLALDHPSLDALAQALLRTRRDPVLAALDAAAPAPATLAVREPAPTAEPAEARVEAIAPTDPARDTRLPADSATYPAIAVIGMAGRLPGAPDLDAYWRLLSEGRDGTCEIPASRWSIERHYSAEEAPGKSISKRGGFIDDIEYFDPDYFGIPISDAAEVDPLIRQCLEVGAACFHHAGYARDELAGRAVGVFVGARTSQYAERLLAPGRRALLGVGQNFIAAHLSHFYDLRGPSMVIDTACSSSLSALHLAIASLHSGESELALAGGVEILLDEIVYQRLSEARVLSPQGRCAVFDERANGFVPGEGAGAVLLKPLQRALADGDRIYAVIEATALNNDGRTMGVTTPNPAAQQRVVREALRRAGVDARAIGYVEAHGTGTALGDPVELRALTELFSADGAVSGACPVGSVKSNLGHLLSAAGIASLLKVVLALGRRELPPTLHCQRPNPRFDFAASPFRPCLHAEAWTGPLRAGISSFGFGGTNAHAIVAAAPPHAPRRQPLPPPQFRRRRFWLERAPASAAPAAPAPVAAPALAPISGRPLGALSFAPEAARVA